MPLRGRTSALGEGQDTPAHSDGVAVGEEARAWRGPGGPSPAERRGRECAPKIRSAREYLGGGRGRAIARADWLP